MNWEQAKHTTLIEPTNSNNPRIYLTRTEHQDPRMASQDLSTTSLLGSSDSDKRPGSRVRRGRAPAAEAGEPLPLGLLLLLAEHALLLRGSRGAVDPQTENLQTGESLSLNLGNSLRT